MEKKKEVTRGHKRAKILPGEQVSFNTRASATRFVRTMEQLSDSQKQWLISLGFGGMLQLNSMDVIHELCDWLISCFNTEYCYIDLEGGRKLHVTETDVGSVLGVSCSGCKIDVRGVSVRATLTSLIQLEQSVVDEIREGEFKKNFCIYACDTVLSPASRPEGLHDLWHFIMGQDTITLASLNWGEFVIRNLVEGIRDFRRKRPTYMRGGIIFLQERAPYYRFRQLIRLIHHSDNKSFPQLLDEHRAQRVSKKTKAT